MNPAPPEGAVAAAAASGAMACFLLALLAALLALVLAMCGCGAVPDVRQQPRAEISTTGDVEVEQPTISDIARDVTARIESVGGDVSQVGFQLDEQRRLLEERQMRYVSAVVVILISMLGGGFVIALASPPLFWEPLRPWIGLAGAGAILCGLVYAAVMLI